MMYVSRQQLFIHVQLSKNYCFRARLPLARLFLFILLFISR